MALRLGGAVGHLEAGAVGEHLASSSIAALASEVGVRVTLYYRSHSPPAALTNG
jgi:hypothetical protein